MLPMSLMERHIQTDRMLKRRPYIQRDVQTERHTYKEKYIQRDINTERQKYRETYIRMGRQRYVLLDREAGRQASRQ